MNTTDSNVVPLTPIAIFLPVKRIKKGWWMGRVPGAVFFGYSAGEVLLKFRKWRRDRLRAYVGSVDTEALANKIIARVHPARAHQVH